MAPRRTVAARPLTHADLGENLDSLRDSTRAKDVFVNESHIV